ncbi:MAG: sulfite exporter TauE/SafE family protein [Proteobacteria bacterium]|nr:sulfite exporter TauE/SafE family protein [Pseudomonadota bacterium]MBU1736500.1 sulfite exporter TauE/SafE family protein [Pseudomonadota bacterium]
MTQGILLCLLTFVASGIGTATGFGTSTVMMPVLTLFFPVPLALLFVGIIHLCGDLWKVLLFRSGCDWKLVLCFGLSGIIASFLGASFSLSVPALPLKKMLGLFLILYVIFLFLKRDWAMPQTGTTALAGGFCSGLFAGFFGVGGAVRGAFLAAFKLPKEVYIFTSGLIALFIDLTRVSRYLWGGTRISGELLYFLLACIPLSFAGAYLAKKFLSGISRDSFRTFVGVFLALVGATLLFRP